MKILAIETSCDETSAAVVEKKKISDKIIVHSNIISSSVSLHASTGGIIPENAAREQVKYIIPVIVEAIYQYSGNKKNISYQKRFQKAKDIIKNEIDAIALTVGPGLIGSLLVGVETAKTLSLAFNKPLIPVNHLLGHLYANFIKSSTNNYQLLPITYPFIGLIVSGGHTDLLLFEGKTKYRWLGGTRDDAAGEALDKIGRLLDLSYPAGPEIEKRAQKVKKSIFTFKSPLLLSDDFDFSFSGLKTEVQRFLSRHSGSELEERDRLLDRRGGGEARIPNGSWTSQDDKLDEQTKNEVCAAVQKAVFDVLIAKTLKAAQIYNAKSILLGGGVSANQSLKNMFELNAKKSTLSTSKGYKLKAEIFSPEKIYCTDNAAMIGAAACFMPEEKPWSMVEANPELYFK